MGGSAFQMGRPGTAPMAGATGFFEHGLRVAGVGRRALRPDRAS